MAELIKTKLIKWLYIAVYLSLWFYVSFSWKLTFKCAFLNIFAAPLYVQNCNMILYYLIVQSIHKILIGDFSSWFWLFFIKEGRGKLNHIHVNKPQLSILEKQEINKLCRYMKILSTWKFWLKIQNYTFILYV